MKFIHKVFSFIFLFSTFCDVGLCPQVRKKKPARPEAAVQEAAEVKNPIQQALEDLKLQLGYALAERDAYQNQAQRLQAELAGERRKQGPPAALLSTPPATPPSSTAPVDDYTPRADTARGSPLRQAQLLEQPPKLSDASQETRLQVQVQQLELHLAELQRHQLLALEAAEQHKRQALEAELDEWRTVGSQLVKQTSGIIKSAVAEVEKTQGRAGQLLQAKQQEYEACKFAKDIELLECSQHYKRLEVAVEAERELHSWLEFFRPKQLELEAHEAYTKKMQELSSKYDQVSQSSAVTCDGRCAELDLEVQIQKELVENLKITTVAGWKRSNKFYKQCTFLKKKLQEAQARSSRESSPARSVIEGTLNFDDILEQASASSEAGEEAEEDLQREFLEEGALPVQEVHLVELVEQGAQTPMRQLRALEVQTDVTQLQKAKLQDGTTQASVTVLPVKKFHANEFVLGVACTVCLGAGCYMLSRLNTNFAKTEEQDVHEFES